jgi:hypothetical protein
MLIDVSIIFPLGRKSELSLLLFGLCWCFWLWIFLDNVVIVSFDLGGLSPFLIHHSFFFFVVLILVVLARVDKSQNFFVFELI